MLSVWKLTMVEMKLSRCNTERIAFQSVVDSPKRRQIDSRAILTGGGGLDIDLTSTRFCFLIDWTALNFQPKRKQKNKKKQKSRSNDKLIIKMFKNKIETNSYRS